MIGKMERKKKVIELELEKPLYLKEGWMSGINEREFIEDFGIHKPKKISKIPDFRNVKEAYEYGNYIITYTDSGGMNVYKKEDFFESGDKNGSDRWKRI